MLNKFKEHINKNLSFLKESKLLLTVSGGIDSVILTHLLHQLKYNVTIAHCNFCLREKDADNDQLFVQNLAKKLNIPFFVTHFNTEKFALTHKLSIQEAARNLRYNWFDELVHKKKLDYILTAHNLNDSLETFLINLSRGTGLKGLTGIPSVNKKIIRPLLAFSRKEIMSFALENKIKWREDKSNADMKYTRNKIRHQIIPVLETLNPNLLDSFTQTLENLQGSASIVKTSVEEKIDNIQKTRDTSIIFTISELKKLKNTKAYIHEIFTVYNFTNFDDIINLLSAQSGKQLFSKTHRLIKDRDFLLLEDRKDKKQNKKQEYIINENDLKFEIKHVAFNVRYTRLKIQDSRLKIQDSRLKTQDSRLKIQDSRYKTQDTRLKIQGTRLETQDSRHKLQHIKPKTFYFDKSLLKFPLTVRKWQKGDYFYPIGMQGKKKLSKYFKDEKMSLLEKENIWLLLSDNKIVWIIGKRQDERFKITKTTTEIMQITGF